MLRQFQRVLSQSGNITARRNFFGPRDWGSNPFVVMDRALREIDREFRHLEKNLGFPNLIAGPGAIRPWRPFVDEHPTEVEFFRIRNPIVAEDGVKKFKLEFDVRRFKPEDVKIKTNSKDRTLQVEAKTSNENSKFEFFQKVSIPDGVSPSEIVAKFKGDGILEFEALYKEPAKVAPPKDEVLQIKHE